MAREAERLLDSTGWLPEPLRDVDFDDAADAPNEETGALPEFLTDAAGDDNASEEAVGFAPDTLAAE